MARQIAQIQESIINTLVTTAAAVNVTIIPAQWSAYDYRQLITYAVAACIGTLEQLWDAFKVVLEQLVSVTPPQTNIWLQNKVLNMFQYSATNPQFLQFAPDSDVPYYETVNPSLRIVTQCAVVPGYFGTTRILAAKGGANPVPLTITLGGELDALQSFLNALTVPGININAVSGEPDKMYLSATVTYSGQYATIIKPNVEAAINAFLRAIPTTGVVSINSPVGLLKLTDLIAAVKSVPGVTDFELINVNIRPNANAFPPVSNNMVDNFTWILPEWNSGLQGGAGYIVGETTPGYEITNTIIYNAI